jgi:hypothetical protein
MTTRQICSRFSLQVAEEIYRIAKAKQCSTADVVRELVDEALIHRAEAMTASQFELVSKRLDYLEKRFSAFHAMGLQVAAKTLYFARENMLLECNPEQKEFFENDANDFARSYIRNEAQRRKDGLTNMKEEG